MRVTPHEEAVLTNIAFMESVHAKSYSSIFSTLCSTSRDRRRLPLVGGEPNLQRKAQIVMTTTAATIRSSARSPRRCWRASCSIPASTCRCTGRAGPKLTNTADLIRLIIRDEAVHAYIGYKFQKGCAESEEAQQDLGTTPYELLYTIVRERDQYPGLYDAVGLTEDVKKYLRYNATAGHLRGVCCSTGTTGGRPGPGRRVGASQ